MGRQKEGGEEERRWRRRRGKTREKRNSKGSVEKNGERWEDKEGEEKIRVR